IITRTSLLNCTNASLRYWIGAAAKDCLQTDHSSGFFPALHLLGLSSLVCLDGITRVSASRREGAGGCLFISPDGRRQIWRAKAFAALRQSVRERSAPAGLRCSWPAD